MKNKKISNTLYQLIILITSISSYIVLAIDKSEVFDYIYEENRLDLLYSTKLIYGFSLVFVLILTYYASFFIISERKSEIGLLIAEGISRFKLFKRLLGPILNMVLKSSLLGLGIGVFIGEFINLLTVKILRLGLNNHVFKISFTGFLLTLLISFLLTSLSVYLVVREFYRHRPVDIYAGKFRSISKKIIFLGLVLAAIVFSKLSPLFKEYTIYTFVAMVFIYLYYIFVAFIVKKIKIRDFYLKTKLSLIFKEDRLSLSFISLILIIGILSLTFTVFSSLASRESFRRPADFSLYDDLAKIEEIKKDSDMVNMIGEIYPVYGYELKDIDADKLNKDLKTDPAYNPLYSNFIEANFLLRESSFEDIYKLGDDFDLKANETIFLSNYIHDQRLLKSYLGKNDAYIRVAGYDLKLYPEVFSAKIFSNDVVGISQILVVDNSIYDDLIGARPAFAYNVNLSADFINKYGFSKGSDMLRNKFIERNFKYESYIWQAKNAISNITMYLYTFFYLAVIFLIAGLSFLAIKAFIIFEKSKLDLYKLRLMGMDNRLLIQHIGGQFDFLFFIIALISIFMSLVLLFFLDAFYTLNFSFSIDILAKILSVIYIFYLLTLVVFKKILAKLSFERIISYEEDYNN